MRGHLRKGIFAVICTLVSFVFVAPASAGKLWNPDTRQWDIFPDSPAMASNSARRKFKRKLITYRTNEKPGTIIIDTEERYLYHVQKSGKAMRYGIGVGREGFEWNGTERITRKAKWPGWTPPEEMRRREAKKGRTLPRYMKGGPDNPLGARALYLGATIYRIHGTTEDWSIGRAVSSGCIRMFNEDVSYLYDHVDIGAKVVVN
ncbi:putative L,D-transpeptidase ErfK/SrfK precursor [Pseudovibrio sp. W64]|uniref:L,D-transpeptidase n=1 Tax=Pseudovibrio sp. W64 TaxID=1735583 RepID=UPI0007AE7A0F|nr:L,D-transpeptidase [Pseudovibrio sp. W64]KZK77381.1 putative L,D-transpeptidase ErfK/SrfK precursor [Pseudovibrio sp. W64]